MGSTSAIFFIAMAARLVCALWSWSGWHVIHPDSLTLSYFKQGYELAAGSGFIFEGRPEMLHPPGFPILVAMFNMISEGISVASIQLLGALLDSFTAVMVAWIAARFIAHRAGIAAGLCYALWPSAIWGSSGSRTPEGLMAFFIVGALICIIQSEESHSWRVWCWATGAGIAVGIASYLRPDYLLLPLAFAPGLWVWRRKLGHAIAVSLFAQVFALIILFPWAARNHDICGRWIFTSTSVGATLIGGLSEFNNIWGFGPFDEDRYRDAAAKGISSPWSPEADVYFRGVFRKAVSEHPGDYLLTIIRRVPLAIAAPQSFGFDNPWKTQTFTELRKNEGKDKLQVLWERPLFLLQAYGDVLLVAGLNFFGFLACVCMLIIERSRRGLICFLLLPHIYGIGSHLLTHLEARYLLPSTFVLAIGMGWGLNYILSLRENAGKLQPLSATLIGTTY